MPRVKGGIVTHRRHKKVLKLTKGHRGKRHNLFKVAHESMLHALDMPIVTGGSVEVICGGFGLYGLMLLPVPVDYLIDNLLKD